ncbi:MAG TPA: alkaline phosphatase family protein [Candidatus Bathyarchaeia archaeon]|nr:alkaline phosphatase family protein [Candidatus Bathyarchaeia archaeon]
MSLKQFVATAKQCIRISATSVMLFQFSLGGPLAAPARADEHHHGGTATPIKHVIVLIGENRTFDHLFATYVPRRGESVKNLLSEGIIKADGTPGKNFSKAAQFQAIAPFKTTFYMSLNDREKAPYSVLPEPTLNFSPSPATGEPPPFPAATPLALLAGIEPSLEQADLPLLTTGASGAAQTAELPDFDSRIANFSHLPNGPFPLEGSALPYDSYTGDTTHRLYEMWQQSDCNIRNATRENPSGCLNDLYPFVITSYTSEPDPFSFPVANQVDDNGGGNSMAFYNVQKGDVPFLKSLADQYAMSDNYHQAVMGGTGANHVMMGTGDAIFWTDSNGNPSVPPSHIANPNPLPGSNNQYTVDIGFDGNFTKCADSTQPGVDAVRDYLASLPYRPNPNCQANHFYMINNNNPGFLPDGMVDTAGIAKGGSIPPSNLRTIGESLNEKGISWAYYGGAYNAAVKLQQLKEQGQTTTDPTVLVGAAYCNICNFESYVNAIMGDSTQRTEHIKDATDFFAAVDNGTLPAVSFVKPDGLLDGHPASSKFDLFEAMTKKIVDHLTANKELFASTVLFVTVDEGGGFYDSGYIQPLDFFGDGPRIPMIAVSPWTRGGHVSHTYTDHVSILKFIERNWDLQPLTRRSRDNFPNPRSNEDNAYVPKNSPALGDLFDLFNFDHGRDHDGDHDHD